MDVRPRGQEQTDAQFERQRVPARAKYCRITHLHRAARSIYHRNKRHALHVFRKGKRVGT